jgi:hypothetical protein
MLNYKKGEKQITVQSNLIYLCGPHGSGKTSLGKALIKYDSRIIMPELYSRNIKLHTENGQRQILKMASRALENYEYLQIAKENPQNIVLGNRCIYDVKAYNLTFLNKGWITSNMYEINNQNCKTFFSDENSEPLAIIMNPGFEIIKKHLHNRWAKHDKKWLEDDMEYNRLTCEAYAKLEQNRIIHETYKSHRYVNPVLYLEKEIETTDEKDIKFIHDWIISRVSNSKISKSLEKIVMKV